MNFNSWIPIKSIKIKIDMFQCILHVINYDPKNCINLKISLSTNEKMTIFNHF